MRLILLTLFFLFILQTGHSQQQLNFKDGVLIKECFLLQNALGKKVWNNWNGSNTPFLFKTKTTDFLINHPNPPSDFSKTYNPYLKKDVWVRANKDTFNYQATYPVNDVLTVVITEPDEETSPYLWVLKAVHEMFHVYQADKCPLHPFVGVYQGYNELNFPFIYSDDTIKSMFSLEGIELYTALKKVNWTITDSIDIPKVFKIINKLNSTSFPDSLQFDYKKYMEWKEGVARYTEREVAKKAAQTNLYKPSKEFTLLFPSSSFKKIFAESYSDESMFNPLRFLSTGVNGNVIFYFTGLAKASMLDRLSVYWKKQYFTTDLDKLITK